MLMFLAPLIATCLGLCGLQIRGLSAVCADELLFNEDLGFITISITAGAG